MEYNIRDVILPIDILNLKQEVNEINFRVVNKLRDIRKGLESKVDQEDYCNKIKYIVHEYNAKQQTYRENFLSDMQILAGFKFNSKKLGGENHQIFVMYLKLCNAVCDKIRKETKEYRNFLLAIENPNVYFEKQKHRQQEKPSGFVAAKLNSKPEKHILGDGSSLPPVVTREYDESLRHRTIKTTRSYR